MKTITLGKQSDQGEDRLTLSFKYDAELVRIARGIKGIRWSRTMNCYYMAFNEDSISNIQSAFANNATIDFSLVAYKPEMEKIKIQDHEKENKEKVTEGDEEFFIDSLESQRVN
jgi:hypothetical protein